MKQDYRCQDGCLEYDIYQLFSFLFCVGFGYGFVLFVMDSLLYCLHYTSAEWLVKKVECQERW